MPRTVPPAGGGPWCAPGRRGVRCRVRAGAAAGGGLGVAAALGGLGALLLFAACGGGAAAAGEAVWAAEHVYREGEVTVWLRLDRTQITTAQQVLVQVETAAPEGSTVLLPRAEAFARGGGSGAGVSNHFAVSGTGTEPPALDPRGLVRWTRWFALRPFLAGDYTVPSLTVAVQPPAAAGDGAAAGQSVLLATDEVAVTVASVLAPGAAGVPELREVGNPVAVPVRSAVLLLLAGGAALTAALVVLAVLYLKRRAARRRAQVEVVPPQVAALRALDRLEAQDLLRRGELTAFHTAVAAVLRVYLEQRFAVHAPERTTEELMRTLDGESWLDTGQRRALHAFLAQCDQVKFARARPGDEISRALLDTARQLVHATWRVTQPEEADVAV